MVNLQHEIATMTKQKRTAHQVCLILTAALISVLMRIATVTIQDRHYRQGSGVRSSLTKDKQVDRYNFGFNDVCIIFIV